MIFVIHQGSFHLGSRDSTPSSRPVWLLVHPGSWVYCNRETRTIPVPLPSQPGCTHGKPSCDLHLSTSQRAGKARPKCRMTAQARASSSGPISPCVPRAICQNKLILQVALSCFSPPQAPVCHLSEFPCASWPGPGGLQQAIEPGSQAIQADPSPRSFAPR